LIWRLTKAAKRQFYLSINQTVVAPVRTNFVKQNNKLKESKLEKVSH